MKFFGWMHQKLCLGTAEYHRVARRNFPDVIFADGGSGKNGALSATHEKEIGTEALLFHHVLLTIGTFGHSNSAAEPTPPQSERQPSADDQEDELKQEEALNSAVVEPTAALMLPSPTLQISTLPQSAIIELGPEQKQEAVMAVHEEEMVISREPLLKEDNERIEIKRTTLADLLAADQEKARTTDDDPAPVDKKQTACRTKNVPKKIRNAESPPASKKIHRLITRMLKKKIHPDLARGDQERHARRGAAVDDTEGRSGDFRLPRGGS